MEPKLPAPHGSPEMRPPVVNPERAPHQGGVPERAPERPAERQESREQKPAGNDGSAPSVAVPDLPPAPPPMPDPLAAGTRPQDDNPAIAADDDVIEKEWVERAKKVIAEARHDPYMQEQAVSRLKADYLQKRYGKSIRLPDQE